MVVAKYYEAIPKWACKNIYSIILMLSLFCDSICLAKKVLRFLHMRLQSAPATYVLTDVKEMTDFSTAKETIFFKDFAFAKECTVHKHTVLYYQCFISVFHLACF